MKKQRKHNIRNIKNCGKVILHWFEITLGVIALIAVATMTVYQMANAFTMDWSNIDTFLETLKIILQLAIGIELARLLFSYSLSTIIELSAFIVARKLLLLEDDFVALILGILSLVLLFAARHFFIEDDVISKKIEEKN